MSEYFIYTIEGTETIPNGWSKRMRSFESPAVPLKIQYRYRVPEYGDQLVRMYLLTNDKESKLGTTPLPDGMVRVFRDNGRDGLSFVAAQPIKYIPIGDKIELNLGPDPEVIFEWIKLRTWRDNLWMQIDGTDVYRRVDDGAMQIEVNSTRGRLGRAHALHPADPQLHGQADRRGDPPHAARPHHVSPARSSATLHDFQTVEYQADVPAGARRPT